METEPTEDLMIHFNCSEKSIEIYRSRLRILLSILNKGLTDTNPEFWNPSRGDFALRAKELAEKILCAKLYGGEEYSDLSKKNFVDVALRELFLSRAETSLQTWQDAQTILIREKLILEAKYLQKPREEVDYDSLCELVEADLPQNSMNYFLMKVYLEVPVRDDLQLRYFDTEDEALKWHGQNCMWYNSFNGVFIVCIRKSKRLEAAQHLYELSKPLSAKLLAWIQKLPRLANKSVISGQRCSTQEYPFGTGKHTRRVGNILTALGIKRTRANINIIRRAVADKAKKGTAEDIADAALLSLHSVSTARNAYESNVSSAV